MKRRIDCEVWVKEIGKTAKGQGKMNRFLLYVCYWMFAIYGIKQWSFAVRYVCY